MQLREMPCCYERLRSPLQEAFTSRGIFNDLPPPALISDAYSKKTEKKRGNGDETQHDHQQVWHYLDLLQQ